MTWTIPRTWVAGEIVTASMLNTHVRDNFNAIGTWTDYTPAWTAATTNPVLNNGTKAGRYIQAGDLVFVDILVTMGSTTTYGSGTWSISLPITPRSGVGHFLAVSAVLNSSSPNRRLGMTSRISSSTPNMYVANSATIGDWNAMSGTVPGGWVSGDNFQVSGNYEQA